MRLSTCIPTLILLFFLQAGPCHAHGGYHEEIMLCDKQLAADPNNAGLWFHRSRLNYLHGDWKKSLADLDHVEALAPGRHPVGLARGQALMAGGDLQAAKKSLDAFIKDTPDVAEAFTNRATLMMKLDDPDAAAADFRKACDLKKPPEPDDFCAWADACIQAGHPQLAIRALESGIARLGALPALADKTIAIDLSLNDYDSALKRVLDQQEHAPRPEPWMAKRASILAQAGRLEQSKAVWTELRDHLLALPASQLASHAMSSMLEQTRLALEALANNHPNSVDHSNPTP